MGRGRIFIYLALIIILGLVAVVVIVNRVPGLLGGGGPAPEAQPTPIPVTTIPIVVTTQRIPRGGEITNEVVQFVEIEEDLLIEGMMTNIDDVIGRRARFDLDAGIPLTQNMVVESIEDISRAGSDAALLIPRGMVAVSIPVSRLSSVSYGLERGDQVNVIATFPFVDLDAEYQSLLPNSTSAVIAPGPSLLLTVQDQDQIDSTLIADDLVHTVAAQSASGGDTAPQGRVELDPNLNQPFYIVPSEPQRARVVSQALIQGAIVLQLGTFELPGEAEFQEFQRQQEELAAEGAESGQPPPAEPPAEEAGPQAPTPPDIVTLVVTPQDAVTLNYLIYSGAQVSLAMRSADDDTRVDIEAVTLQFLLDEYNIPVPAKLPFGLQPRIDELVPPILQNDIPEDTGQQ